MRRAFGRQELDGSLRSIGAKLRQPATCFLIGGCAMTFMGQKTATKDIDIVVTGPEDLQALIGAMRSAGFSKVPEPEWMYKELDAMVITENSEGMRFDLFQEVVCRKLALSESMRSRSREYGRFGKLAVHLTAPEDIFLFKSVTDRPGDLDDMSVLAAGGLNWQIIRDECLSQESGRNWASYLVGRMQDLQEKYDIKAPIIQELQEWAQIQIIAAALSGFLKNRERSFEEIRGHLGEKYGFSKQETRADLSKLLKYGMLRVRKVRGKRYYSRASQSVILKKIQAKSAASWKEQTRTIRKKARALRLTRRDVDEEVKAVRAAQRR